MTSTSSTDGDEQACLKEGTAHESHCVEDQGHWHCPGVPGSVEAELRASNRMHEQARRLADQALTERDDLRKIIENAPHAFPCVYFAPTWQVLGDPCTCWKSSVSGLREAGSHG